MRRPGRDKRVQGFSLIEALILVTLTTVLVLIATANPLETQTRSRGNLIKSGPYRVLGSINLDAPLGRVEVRGKLAYAAYSTPDAGGLKIIDVSDPKRLKLVSTFHPVDDWLSGIAVGNRLVFLTFPNVGLVIADVSNPSSPTHIGSLKTPGVANDVAIEGKLAFVADQRKGLQIINASDPRNPKIIGNCDVGADIASVYIQGNLAYLTSVAFGNRQKGDLWVIDVSKPSKPVLIGKADASWGATHVAVREKYVYVTTFGSDNPGLLIFDVSTPNAPKLKGSYESTDVSSVHVEDATAFLTSPNGLMIIDVSDPSKPVYKMTINSPLAIGCVALQGKNIYITSGNKAEYRPKEPMKGELQIVTLDDD